MSPTAWSSAATTTMKTKAATAGLGSNGTKAKAQKPAAIHTDALQTARVADRMSVTRRAIRSWKHDAMAVLTINARDAAHGGAACTPISHKATAIMERR